MIKIFGYFHSRPDILLKYSYYWLMNYAESFVVDLVTFIGRIILRLIKKYVNWKIFV